MRRITKIGLSAAMAASAAVSIATTKGKLRHKGKPLYRDLEYKHKKKMF